MNIFEDLIEELKEENLIEQTVTETHKAESDAKKLKKEIAETEAAEAQKLIENSEETIAEENLSEISTENSSTAAADGAEAARQEAFDEENFYRRRAMEEVDFLQTVEHVFAGIEREQLKIVPTPYDDLKVKKVLHSFLQIAPDANPAERDNAHFQLLQETESWHSSLALRDIPVLTANLRRYCETSRPPLGAPALIALARFYRNSPYSDQVRSKFDLVLTRLFTKEAGDRREMLFTRDELAEHIKELYAEWSSVPLYSIEEDDTQTAQTAGHFEEFIREADAMQSFDEMLNSNFFNRLRLFKESTNEVFYAPLVAATGVEVNARVGNKYVELLNREKEKGGAAALEDKYGLAHDQTVSEATGKTTSLIELLRQKKPAPAPVEEKTVAVEPVKAKPAEPAKAVETAKSGMSKWVISALILLIIIAGVYLITSSDSAEQREVSTAPRMNLGNSMLNNYLENARIQDQTLNAVVLPAWEKLSEDKKKEVLKQILILGGEKGFNKIELKNKEGKTVGTAEGENLWISN